MRDPCWFIFCHHIANICPLFSVPIGALNCRRDKKFVFIGPFMKDPFLLVSGCIPEFITWDRTNSPPWSDLNAIYILLLSFIVNNTRLDLILTAMMSLKRTQSICFWFRCNIYLRAKREANSLVTTPFAFNGQRAPRSIRIIGRLSRLLRSCCLMESVQGITCSPSWIIYSKRPARSTSADEAF